MPTKGVYSQTIQPNQYVAPLDLNVYMKGVMYKEELAKQNLQDLSTVYSGLTSIPAYGKDAEMLQTKIQELKDNLGKMNISNLGDINTSSSLKQMIGQTSSDVDILNITRRGMVYTSELKRKKEAEAKNEFFTSPILDQAEKYYSGDTYIRDKTFNGDGWNTPQMGKLKAKYLEGVPKVKKQVKIGNYDYTIESYDDEAYKSRLQDMWNSPLVKKQMDYDFDQEYENYDFATEGVASAQKTIDKAKLQSDQAYHILQTSKQGSPTYNDALEKYQEAQSFITDYTPLVSNPGLLGENLKAKMKQDKINKSIELDIAGEQFSSVVDMKANQFELNTQKFGQDIYLKGIEHQNRMEEKQAEDISLGASINSWSLAETIADPAKRMKAAIDGQSAKLAEFDAKESIKLQNKIKAQQEKAKSLSNMKPGDTVQYYDSKTSSQIGVSWSRITESTKNKENANKDKQFIFDLINTLRVKNGQDILTDPTKLIIDSKGDMKYNDSYIPFGDQELTNLAKLADPLTYMNVDVTFGNNTTPPIGTDTTGTATAERMNKMLGK